MAKRPFAVYRSKCTSNATSPSAFPSDEPCAPAKSGKTVAPAHSSMLSSDSLEVLLLLLGSFDLGASFSFDSFEELSEEFSFKFSFRFSFSSFSFSRVSVIGVGVGRGSASGKESDGNRRAGAEWSGD